MNPNTPTPKSSGQNYKLIGLLALILVAGMVFMLSNSPSDSATSNTNIKSNSNSDYQKSLLGDWVIENWRDPVEGFNEGAMSIDTIRNENTLQGDLRIYAGLDGRLIKQDIRITLLSDGSIKLKGNVTEGLNWASDSFLLRIEGDRLIGGGSDSGGNHQEVIFKKIN